MMDAKIIWEFIELDNKLSPSNFLERVSLYSSLYIQPIWSMLYWITWLLVPSLFEYLGGSYDMDVLRMGMMIANTLSTAYSSYTRWSEWVQHYTLGTTLLGWRLQTLRVPKIHIRSRDPRHQFFKYAAAMTQLQSPPKTSTQSS